LHSPVELTDAKPKPTAEPKRANQQPPEAAKARRGGKPEREPKPTDGGPPLAERQPPRRLFYSEDVPKFASPEERLAYYETRRLDNPPYSIWDSNDARRGAPTAAERNHRKRPTITAPKLLTQDTNCLGRDERGHEGAGPGLERLGYTLSKDRVQRGAEQPGARIGVRFPHV
jgi:hypothetical protein